ncbi:MAG: hypothetical protein GEV10_26865 [Streptosporangiales bacterium]|nr:hypothetical protein [Streptosporangiales bacterium]
MGRLPGRPGVEAGQGRLRGGGSDRRGDDEPPARDRAVLARCRDRGHRVRLEYDAVVGLPLDDAWRRVTDLARVASCLPGARLDAVVDGECRGALATDGAHYTGVARFLERDDVDHRAVVEVRGSEGQGDGAATGTVVATLRVEGTGTRISLSADLVVSGTAARAKDGALAEAGTRLLAALAAGLSQDRRRQPAPQTARPSGDGTARPAPVETPRPRRDVRPDADGATVVPMLRRAAVPVAGAVVAGALGWYLGRHGRRD